jgi:hypothetical protein
MGDPQTPAPVVAVISRRELLVRGLAGAAGLAVVGAIYEFSPDPSPRDSPYRYTMLDAEDRAIVAAIAPVMLGIRGTIPQVIRGLDVAISGLPLETRAQLQQLFALLRFPLTRMFIAGVWRPWHQAGAAEISRFLSAWRYSPIAQLRAGYDALHQLTASAWYGNSSAWAAVGYAGPPRID